MAKVADSYFKIDPWKVVEEGFVPEYGMTAESIFSLGNEYMGVRGYFEEGFSGKTLLGSYFNGVYEREKTAGQGYKGIVNETEFMVNSLDWLYVRIEAEGELLDLAKSKIDGFTRVIDFKTGLMTRQFDWKTAKGSLKIKFERLISMVNNEQAVWRMTVESIDFVGEIKVTSGLDFDTVHGGKEKYWSCEGQIADNNLCYILGRTRNTKMEVESYCFFAGDLAKEDGVADVSDKHVFITYKKNVSNGQSVVLEKNILNITPLARAEKSVKAPETCVREMTFDKVLSENAEWWKDTWDKSDIEIVGDEENQQGIRFCIFQMFQTYHGAVKGTNIGAKGLTGESYNGNAFWDTETYCLPFFLFHDKTAAKNLLYFRYATLDEARNRAKALDCKGAFYPIATISGRECCSLWQHASLQLQASTAVAYGIWMYEKVTGDRSFTDEYGLEMLIEISRMLATRGDYNEKHTAYGFYCVMGPDEFQMMVNNNCYTNYMAKFTMNYTLEVIKRMENDNPKQLEKIFDKVGFEREEAVDWKQKADAMLILYDEETKLYEQHQGFFDLPHVDVDAIPVEDFPLYHHWSYDRIYRNDMIKQPDVLMFMLMFNSHFSEETLKNNYEYYEPRCIHESSLSPSVHSILAAQLSKPTEAFEFFRFATRMDLDNYNRNTVEGLHTTSIAAAWMNIVYGFGGLRSDGDILSLAPSIPENWKGYKFRIVYDDKVLCIEVDTNDVTLSVVGEGQIDLLIYGTKMTIDTNKVKVAVNK